MVHPYAKKIVQDMHLFLMPTMNPDGYALGPQRYNAYVYKSSTFYFCVQNEGLMVMIGAQVEGGCNLIEDCVMFCFFAFVLRELCLCVFSQEQQGSEQEFSRQD